MLKQFLIIFGLIISYLGLSQKPFIHLTIDPKTVEVGEEVTVTIKYNIEGELSTNVPSGFKFSGNVMNQTFSEADLNTGKFITYNISSRTGEFNKEGSFIFGPAYIKKDNKVYKSNSIAIKVEKNQPNYQGSDEVTSKQFRQPAFGLIQKSRTKVFEGQPFVLETKICSRFYPDDLGNYTSYEIGGLVEKFALDNQKTNVSQELIKGVPYYIIQSDRHVVFPSETGKLTIKPFKVSLVQGFDNYTLTSNTSMIEVISLPKGKPSSFSGLIGDYTFKREFTQNSVKKGDIIQIKLLVSGVGNLHKIKFKNFKLPNNVKLYGDPVVKNDFQYTKNGSEGEIEYTLNVRINDGGNINFSPFEFSYFDPEKEKYVTLVEKGISIFSEGEKESEKKNAISTAADRREDIIYDKSMDKNEISNRPIISNNALAAILGVPALFLLFLFLYKKKRRETSHSDVDENKIESINLNPNKELISEDDFTQLIINQKRNIQKMINEKKNDETFILIADMLNDYASNKIQHSSKRSLDKSEIIHYFESKQIDKAQILAISNLLDVAFNIKYGMGLSINEAQDFIKDYAFIENIIK